jgi:glycoside/pentoside/hexuronide:cation symporter, GPH family
MRNRRDSDTKAGGGHYTAPEDRIPLKEKLFYGSGIVAFQICNNAIPLLAYPIYNILLGVPAAWVGWVLMAGRIWDAFTDPVMGSVSDNTRTRWGRRKPYILTGAALSALLYIGVWFVPESLSVVGKTVYFLISALLFFTAFTIFAVPYTSQGFELTPDSHERTRLMGVRTYFAILIGLVIPWIFAIAQWDGFPSPMVGVRVLACIIGVLVLVSVLPTLLVKERFEKRVQTQQKVPLIGGMKETLKNRAFQSLIGLTVAIHMTMLIVQSIGLYVTIYHVFDGDVKMGAVYGGYVATIMTISGLITIPLITLLAKKVGKVRAMGMVVALALFADCVKWFLYTPACPPLLLITPMLIGPVHAAFWLLVNSMKADVPDDDELRTGMRREGMYGAMATWIQKFAMSFAFIFTGFVLSITGFEEGGETQSAPTILGIRVAFILVPAVGDAIALLLLKYYPLTESRLAEIRIELEERRGKL